MRRFRPAAISVVFALAALSIGASGNARAQEQTQPAQGPGQQDQQPAAPQGKKPAAKPNNAGGSSSPQASSSSASYSDSSPGAGPAAAENPFPEAVSEKAAQSSSPDAPPEAPAASPKAHSAAADNPFPEDVSRRAAKGGTDSSAKENPGEKQESQEKRPEPSGVSPDEGGRDDSLLQAVPGSKAGKPLDPARAKEDTRVGRFYMQSGDYRGAYLRYKDALAYDPANVDAVFGLAEAARALKLVSEAERNYELYLDIVPDGSKAKDAAKALHSLETQR